MSKLTQMSEEIGRKDLYVELMKQALKDKNLIAFDFIEKYHDNDKWGIDYGKEITK